MSTKRTTRATASKLEEAILFAVRAHEGQKHAFGSPYILHPLRVMNRVNRAGGNEQAMITAVLHDVQEDCDVTNDTIRAMFGDTVADAVEILSRKNGTSYTEYVSLIGNNQNRALTVMVKLADLSDNLALGKEFPLPEPSQSKLNARYKAAQKYLKNLPLEVTQC